MVGYVSITPPGQARYSLDGYLPRADWPFEVSDSLYEIRLLTVIQEHRGKLIASALMYAAFRYIQDRGGKRIMATGRREVASIYRRIGLHGPRDRNPEWQGDIPAHECIGIRDPRGCGRINSDHRPDETNRRMANG